MASKVEFETWVKGDPKTKTLGDCPFCHRVLLVLEEKKNSYNKDFVDFADKPKWLLEVNPAGSVPVVKDTDTGEWFTDSGKFCDYLEDKHPEPKLGKTSDIPDVANKVFPAFIKLIKAASDDQNKQATEEFEQVLGELDQHLQQHGPYLTGSSVSAGDLMLGPRLHHADIALPHFKDYSFTDKFHAVGDYLSKLRSLPSWQKNQYSNDLVYKGWESKVGSG